MLRLKWVGVWVCVLFGASLLAGCGRARSDASGGSAGQSAAEAGSSASSTDVDAAGAGAASDNCTGRLIQCDDACVDPKFDPEHCGGCDTACAGGELCSGGECSVSCLGGTTQCGARCVDVDRDPANCGACGKACPANQVCTNGACGIVCLGGTTRCGSRCVDTRYDPANCGACDNACDDAAVCSNGSCGKACAAGRVACSGECVDTALDSMNCGACGHVCANGAACSAGSCGTECNDSILCGNACVDPLTDSANCGGCNKPCVAGQTCVNGSCGLHCELTGKTLCGAACVDTMVDSTNCGACYTSCGSGRSCASGACVCDGAKKSCLGVCTDTSVDTANCGECGVACGTNEACGSGKCDCRAGTTRCAGTCVDTSVNAANCGACGSPCAAGKVCTDGVCAAATSDWPTFQFGVTHTGENPDETGKPPLTLSWQRKLGAGLHPAAAGGGRVFVTAAAYFSDQAPLQALDLSDGSDLWSYNFGAVDSLGHPAVFGNAVYVANGKGIASVANPYLWSFDAATGDTNWAAQLVAQWEQYWAPIVVNGIVYTNAGEYGGLFGISALDGSQKFFVGLDQYDSWSPAYFSGNIYTFIAGSFRKQSPTDGSVLSTVAINWNWEGYSMTTAPVFDDTRGYVIAPPNLVAVNPTQATIAWTANGTYTGTPAVSGGLVFGISAGNLIARDAATGTLAWTFVGDTTLSYPPVIANGFVYVASNSHVYAVDIASHMQAFQGTFGGWLTISSRRLIVAGADGTLSAYLMSK